MAYPLGKKSPRRRAFPAGGLLVLLAGLSAPAPGLAQGVIEEWSHVQVPPPPPLVKVTLDAGSTALLVLDLATQTCNATQRPRCIAMLPRVKALLAHARAKGMFVVYTLGAASTPADILPDVAMRGGEPVVTAPPDKFAGTDLDAILKAKGIKTAVVVGAAAHGAVLHTAAGAAFRGYDVVVPVDGMASETAYAEQYVAWDLVNAPRLADRVKLTRTDWID